MRRCPATVATLAVIMIYASSAMADLNADVDDVRRHATGNREAERLHGRRSGHTAAVEDD